MPVFSPDGTRIAYVGNKDQKEYVILDGKPGPASSLLMGQLLVDLANRKHVDPPRHVYRVYGRVEPTNRADVEVGPLFSPDSKRIAYVAWSGPKSNKWTVVVDGRSGPEFDDIDQGPTFSADSKHFAYVAMKEQKRLVILDGAPISSLRGTDVYFPPRMIFDPDGTLDYMAVKSNILGQMRIPLDSTK
jgi:Tol biopolymer transport system component